LRSVHARSGFSSSASDATPMAKPASSRQILHSCRQLPTRLRRAADGNARALQIVMHESQQIATEHRDLAAHAHGTGAERHGKEDHLTGHESSRQNLEHSNQAYLQSQKEHQGNAAEHGGSGLAHEVTPQEVGILAYQLWQTRGCPEGSPDEDWFHAIRLLRSRQEPPTTKIKPVR